MRRLPCPTRCEWWLLVVTGMAVVVGYVVIALRVVVIPVAVALLFTALLGPVVDWLTRHRVPRGLATVVVLIGGLALIGGLLAFVIEAFVTGLPAVATQVVAPFAWEDNTCDSCREGLHTSCRHGGFRGDPGVDGGQGEAVRVPQAQGTLVKLPVGEDSALLPSLLTLSDVFCTGHHCAVKAGVGPRTSVTVIGDGAVGLSAVLAAKRLGAERILLMGRHKERTDLGREFGATDVIAERGDEGIARARELTGGDGTHTVLECVGTKPALEMALGVARDGGVVSRVGTPQYEEGPIGFGMFMRTSPSPAAWRR